MVCPKCGALVEDNQAICDNCQYVFEDNIVSPAVSETQNPPALIDSFENGNQVQSNRSNFILLILSLLAAISIIILTFYGTHFMSLAGAKLNNMHMTSAGIFGFGQGTDPSYYVYMGAAIYGLSFALKGIGIGFASLITIKAIKDFQANK